MGKLPRKAPPAPRRSPQRKRVAAPPAAPPPAPHSSEDEALARAAAADADSYVTQRARLLRTLVAESDVSEQDVAVLLPSVQQSEIPEDDPTALSVEQQWIRARGWTPLEFLVYAYRSPFIKVADRINAAKAVLDYAHKRIPTAYTVGSDGKPVLLPVPVRGGMDLSNLSEPELDALAALLQKANAAKGSS